METDEEVEALRKQLKEINYKPIESPLEKLYRWIKKKFKY